jgi:hypothetical protein
MAAWTGGDIGVKALAVLDYRRQQEKSLAPSQLRPEGAAHLVPGLGVHGHAAVRTVLSPQPGEEQAQPMGITTDDTACKAAAGLL